MPTKTETLAGQIKTRRKDLAKLFEDHKTPNGYDLSREQVEHVQAETKALEDLQQDYERELAIEKAADNNRKALDDLNHVKRPSFKAMGGDGSTLGGGNGDDPRPMKSLGDLFVENCYNRDGQAIKKVDFSFPDWDPGSIKTTMTTSAGFSPENLRSGRQVLSAQRPITLLDMLPMIPVGVGNNAYVYMEETTFTNNAAEIAENSGSGAPEGALAWTERSENIRNVATFLPVTNEQLADVTGMRALIDQRLTYMIRLRAEAQVLAGDGNSPNLNGFNTRVTQTQALGADPVFDAIFKGMIKVMHTGYATPTGCVLHPNDWQDIRLTRTLDGIYILGNPGDVGPERLFGVPVTVTNAQTQNTGLVGDFLGYSALVYRSGVEVTVSDSHSDYFIKFLQAIRANMRAALAVFRVNAFCKVTGI